VTIPEGVTSIGERAFAYCYDLTSVNFKGKPPSVGDYAFSPISSFSATGSYSSQYASEWEAVIVSGKWNGLKMVQKQETPEDDGSVVSVDFSGLSGVVQGKWIECDLFHVDSRAGECTAIGLPNGISLYQDEDEIGIEGVTNAAVGTYPVQFKFANSAYEFTFDFKVKSAPKVTKSYTSAEQSVPVGIYDESWNEVKTSEVATVGVSITLAEGDVEKIIYETSCNPFVDDFGRSYEGWNVSHEFDSTSDLMWGVITLDEKDAIAVNAWYDAGNPYREFYATIYFWEDGSVSGGVGYYDESEANNEGVYIREEE
jgi:hypothetical protein